MNPKNQEQIIHDSTGLKHRLLDRGLSIQGLANQLKRPRPSVSAAINRGRHPLLLKKIRRFLDA